MLVVAGPSGGSAESRLLPLQRSVLDWFGTEGRCAELNGAHTEFWRSLT